MISKLTVPLNLNTFASVNDRLQNAQRTIEYFASPIDTRRVDGQRTFWFPKPGFDSSRNFDIMSRKIMNMLSLLAATSSGIEHKNRIFLNLFVGRL